MATPASNILPAAFLVAGVAAMFILHVLVIFWALRRGLGAGADEERGQADSCAGGGAGLTAGELDTLPCCYHREAAADDGGGGAGDCALCLEALEAGDWCRRLPRCEHRLHAPCVDSWLTKSRLCPVCRADVVDRSPRKGEGMAATGERETAAAPDEIMEQRSPAALETYAGIV